MLRPPAKQNKFRGEGRHHPSGLGHRKTTARSSAAQSFQYHTYCSCKAKETNVRQYQYVVNEFCSRARTRHQHTCASSSSLLSRRRWLTAVHEKGLPGARSCFGSEAAVETRFQFDEIASTQAECMSCLCASTLVVLDKHLQQLCSPNTIGTDRLHPTLPAARAEAVQANLRLG